MQYDNGHYGESKNRQDQKIPVLPVRVGNGLAGRGSMQESRAEQKKTEEKQNKEGSGQASEKGAVSLYRKQTVPEQPVLSALHAAPPSLQSAADFII